MGVWNIVLYQDFLKVVPRATLGSHFHGNMKQNAIFGVTEPAPNAASVAPHQLKNSTTPIVTWWLSVLPFRDPITHIPTLFWIMACHQLGDKPSSEAMMKSLLTHPSAQMG